MSFISKIFGDPNAKVIKFLWPIVAEINNLEKDLTVLPVESLRAKTAGLKEKVALAGEDRVKIKEKLDEILPLAFALAREAARRAIGQRPYDVQLIGGLVLHQGQIAEMRTGEGKTLVATLPLFLNSLAGRGVQLVTVNDYLSRLGAGWMAPVFYLLGLSTGVIVHDGAFFYDPAYIDENEYDPRLRHFRPVSRREAYRADILYGTNNEFGFDFLRDNMAASLAQTVQRGYFYAIVDEVDSILIDEARTPLIISAPAEESTDQYFQFASLVQKLKENEDYNVDEKMRAATLTEAGLAKMEKWLGVENIYTSGGIGSVHHIEQALKAHALFKRDRDYVVREGEVIIVDEFTGRLMPGRRYSEGLHQAIEAQEGVPVQRESQTLATITFQNYFRLYEKLAGMTGTAITEAEEFAKIYNLETVVIPTNKPMVRKDLNDLIYRTEMGKFQAVIKDVKKRHAAGQPVLIGTISIEKNEILSELMAREGLEPAILNAKQHDKEARIIAQAGRLGAITIATNMAGRGVDIMLGGHEPAFAETADDQAAGQAGRGAAGLTESEEHRRWQAEHDQVVALGGLHVIGTERHEARRIDNQLRGRAGRQGDPGSSQFYVSTEDDLMRIFGGDRMKRLMQSLNLPEDMPIQNGLITRSIEAAQRKVEGNNFDIRKHLVEYDDVINKHRESIYRKRREILRIAAGPADPVGPAAKDGDGLSGLGSPTAIADDQAKTLSEILLVYVEKEIEKVVSFHTAAEYIKDWNLTEIEEVMNTIFPLPNNWQEGLSLADGHQKMDKANLRTELITRLTALAAGQYKILAQTASANGVDWPQVEAAVLLRSIDTLWIEHLEAMASMRQGIGLRGYGQRDPLVEYKKEAYRLFAQLNDLIRQEAVYSIFKIGSASTTMTPAIALRPESPARRAQIFTAPAKEMSRSGGMFKNAAAAAPESSADAVKAKARNDAGEKIGRNDLCPCGSGKKFKKCCGK
ncbi:preprotein translocase subunit SecA [Candidatus Falkowbacteria bacterium CG23_combo_of_CG06-09_8_20_14_all_49_15]|uniref:Protein translocase subunit SecA n=1 Tax=Candidatus Falkowbacteria bacterium CG23_combo_of_CG06-09_8_20_14_all_49_15 TaxID=1974572 RepID=A0A2G9ZK88_9BACT|nr:MAG: preprotein translocase subunit SecA [Candidatus Falkowbacteria bacterium CG23_combo_of_CG06-09_8_20_14_all_49_15]